MMDDFILLINEFEEYNNAFSLAMSNADQEVGDIEHAYEQVDKSYWMKLSEEMVNARAKRRKLKIRHKKSRLFKNTVLSFLSDKLKNFENTWRKIEDEYSVDLYVPRVRKDLFEQIKKGA
jgi:hypothetical protein